VEEEGGGGKGGGRGGGKEVGREGLRVSEKRVGR